MHIWVVEYFRYQGPLKSDEERKRNISICFLKMVVAVPTFLQSLSGLGGELVKWREGMFHDERLFHRYGLFLGPHFSSAAFRRRREEGERLFSKRHRLDLVRSGGGFPNLGEPHDMDGTKIVRMTGSERQVFVTQGSMYDMISGNFWRV